MKGKVQIHKIIKDSIGNKIINKNFLYPFHFLQSILNKGYVSINCFLSIISQKKIFSLPPYNSLRFRLTWFDFPGIQFPSILLFYPTKANSLSDSFPTRKTQLSCRFEHWEKKIGLFLFNGVSLHICNPPKHNQYCYGFFYYCQTTPATP
jgi:hypothetical protein